MKGMQVGRVRDVALRYVPAAATLETPVVLEIDPRLMGIEVTDGTARDDLRRTVNEALGSLVRKGMRAGLATSLVLPGASAVSLEMSGTPGTAELIVTSDPPIIPAAAGGSGLEGALSSISDVATTIRNLPLQEIAGDLRSASQRMNTLVGDPRLEESLQRMSNALREIEQAAVTANTNVEPIAQSLRNAAASAEAAARTIQSVAGTAEQSVEPIVESLRNAADSAEAAAKSAEGLLGGPARQNYDVAELIRELTRAAEAVRELASYLSENPDSLLKGRRE
jgi:paraquat-inducible protein B